MSGWYYGGSHIGWLPFQSQHDSHISQWKEWRLRENLRRNTDLLERLERIAKRQIEPEYNI